MCENEVQITTQCNPSPNLHQHVLAPLLLTAGQLDGFISWHHCTLPEWKLTPLSLSISGRERKKEPPKRKMKEMIMGRNAKYMHIFIHILCMHIFALFLLFVCLVLFCLLIQNWIFPAFIIFAFPDHFPVSVQCPKYKQLYKWKCGYGDVRSKI